MPAMVDLLKVGPEKKNQKTININGLLLSKLTKIADGYLMYFLLLIRPIAIKQASERLKTIVKNAS